MPTARHLSAAGLRGLVAYALKSYQERVEGGWPLNDYRHVMSPAYLYNQITVPGRGSYIWKALDTLMDQGVSSWSLIPYNQYDDTLPSAAARAEATDYRIAEWGTVLRSGNFVRELKTHVAARSPIVIAIPTYSDFDLIDEDNPVYDDNGGDRRGYHAVTIVGYDDAWSAFRIINSWGTTGDSAGTAGSTTTLSRGRSEKPTSTATPTNGKVLLT